MVFPNTLRNVLAIVVGRYLLGRYADLCLLYKLEGGNVPI